MIGSGFFNYASGFDTTYAIASAGGTDPATFFAPSDGDYAFYSGSDYGYLSADSWFIYDIGFDEIDLNES